MNMNKGIIILAIGLILTVMIAGCTGNSGSADTTGKKGIDAFNNPLPNLDEETPDVNVDLDLGSIGNPIPNSLPTSGSR